jgi:hypothetical protein
MGQIEINHTGSGGGVVLSSDGTDLLLGGSAIGGGGGGAYTREAKTANYTAVAGDLGKILDFTTNSSTLTLTAAATLGAGWYIWVKNSSTNSSHIVTVDANGSETIDGVVTRPLYDMESIQIVCDGSNFFTITGGVHGLAMNMDNIGSVTYQPKPTGSSAISLGAFNYATGNYSFAAGYASTASGTQSTAIGYSADATAQESTAIGTSSRAEGNGSIGLGYNSYATGGQSIAGPDSRASGADSVGFGIGTNSSGYGPTGTNAVAIGQYAYSTGSSSVAIGYGANARATQAICLGASSVTAQGAVAIGTNIAVSGLYSVGFGKDAYDNGVYGKFAFGRDPLSNQRDVGGGLFVLGCSTTDATATTLTTRLTTPAATNQITLKNKAALVFNGLIVGRQDFTDGTDTAAFKIQGIIRREANAGTTVLVNSSVDTIQKTVSTMACTVSADTTLGCLKIQVTGIASHNIRWAGNISTAEIEYT